MQLPCNPGEGATVKISCNCSSQRCSVSLDVCTNLFTQIAGQIMPMQCHLLSRMWRYSQFCMHAMRPDPIFNPSGVMWSYPRIGVRWTLLTPADTNADHHTCVVS